MGYIDDETISLSHLKFCPRGNDYYDSYVICV